MSLQGKITRRGVVTAVAAAGALGGKTFAQSAEGRAVWLEMDQKALDDAYDQSKYAPNMPQLLKRYATTSDATRAHLGPPKRLAYGTTPIEGIDLYASAAPNAPITTILRLSRRWLVPMAFSDARRLTR
jgi:arylformamidase